MKADSDAAAAENAESEQTRMLFSHVKPILLSFAASLATHLPSMSIVFSYLDVILSRSGWDENISTPMVLLGGFFSFIYLYGENFRYIYGIPVFKTAQLKNDYKLTNLHIIILIR